MAVKILTPLVELDKFMKGIIKWDSCNIRTIELMTYSSPVFLYKVTVYHLNSVNFNQNKICQYTLYASSYLKTKQNQSNLPTK